MQRDVIRPISQRGMVKAMSFTAANCTEAMAVLKYYITNTTAQELYSRICMAQSNASLFGRRELTIRAREYRGHNF
jgi:hypothetical protein